jgi:hypothetical protein
MLNCAINTRIFSPSIVAAEAIWFHASGKYSPFLKASIVAEGLKNNKSAGGEGTGIYRGREASSRQEYASS